MAPLTWCCLAASRPPPVTTTTTTTTTMASTNTFLPEWMRDSLRPGVEDSDSSAQGSDQDGLHTTTTTTTTTNGLTQRAGPRYSKEDLLRLRPMRLVAPEVPPMEGRDLVLLLEPIEPVNATPITDEEKNMLATALTRPRGAPQSRAGQHHHGVGGTGNDESSSSGSAPSSRPAPRTQGGLATTGTSWRDRAESRDTGTRATTGPTVASQLRGSGPRRTQTDDTPAKDEPSSIPPPETKLLRRTSNPWRPSSLSAASAPIAPSSTSESKPTLAAPTTLVSAWSQVSPSLAAEAPLPEPAVSIAAELWQQPSAVTATAAESSWSLPQAPSSILRSTGAVPSAFAVPAPPQPVTWLYRDPTGQVQGPFTSQDMFDWYEVGYFEPTLMIRASTNPSFLPLGSLIAQNGGRVPFAPTPRGETAHQDPAWRMQQQQLQQQLQQQQEQQQQLELEKEMQRRREQERQEMERLERERLQQLAQERERILMEQRLQQQQFDRERQEQLERERLLERERIQALEREYKQREQEQMLASLQSMVLTEKQRVAEVRQAATVPGIRPQRHTLTQPASLQPAQNVAADNMTRELAALEHDLFSTPLSGPVTTTNAVRPMQGRPRPPAATIAALSLKKIQEEEQRQHALQQAKREQEEALERDRQQQREQQVQEPIWGANQGRPSQSIKEIQEIEMRKKREETEFFQQLKRQEEQATVAANITKTHDPWSTPRPPSMPSLKTIQTEQQTDNKRSASEQGPSPPSRYAALAATVTPPASAPGGGGWTTVTRSGGVAPRPSAPSPAPPIAKPTVRSTSLPNTMATVLDPSAFPSLPLVSSQKPKVIAPTLQQPKSQQPARSSKDAITQWCEVQLSNVPNVDVATLLSVLSSALTAQEAVDLIADNLSGTLSDSFNPRHFAEEYIKRRRQSGRALTGSYNVGLIDLERTNEPWAPKISSSSSSESFGDNSGTGKKKKKGQKVDASLLGFSVSPLNQPNRTFEYEKPV